MMSNGGQLTFAQKRMLAMQAGNAGDSTLACAQYPDPHIAAVPQRSVPFHSDVEMRDISAATSTDGSPVTIPPHKRVQATSTFSAAAAPFIPPGLAIPETPVPALPVASVMACPVISNSAPPITPAKRVPPHRALKGQTPAAAVMASTTAPITAPVAAATPTPKPVSSATLALSDHSAAPSPKRRAGPHTRLGPHAQRAPVSHSAASVESALPVQVSIPSIATTPVSTTQDAWVDIQQPKSEPEAWVGVQEPEVDMDIEQHATQQVEMETEQAPVQATPVVSAQGWGSPVIVQSVPVVSSPDWGTSAVDEPEHSVTQAIPLPEGVNESPTLEAAPHLPQEQLNVKVQAESTDFALSEEMSTDTTIIRRYGRNEFLPMLLDMTDTAKGREVIRAFADHIHAGGDSSLREVGIPDAQQEVWIELSSGQRIAATVAQSTTLIKAIREVARMTRADESEVRVILKIGNKDST